MPQLEIKKFDWRIYRGAPSGTSGNPPSSSAIFILSFTKTFFAEHFSLVIADFSHYPFPAFGAFGIEPSFLDYFLNLFFDCLINPFFHARVRQEFYKNPSPHLS